MKAALYTRGSITGRSPGQPTISRVSGSTPRILLVDDEHSIQKLLAYPLRKEGYDVVSALDGREALDRLRDDAFDLVVLDLMLPEVDGFEVCRQVRARSAVPIIMLTAKAEEIDKVLGLELGADDYITKPFSVREFRSRVKAVLRRAEMVRADEPLEEPLERGDLRIDFEKRQVEMRGEAVRLTYVEFEILAALARSPGRVFSRGMLLERVWGDASYRDPRTVDVHIRHLREKLESDPKHPELILTVRGVGYRFRDR
jgi:DNA-binding response OmpR family regulator